MPLLLFSGRTFEGFQREPRSLLWSANANFYHGPLAMIDPNSYHAIHQLARGQLH